MAPSAFSEQSFSDNVNMDIARISQFITITVTNTDVADHRFTATLLGTVYE